MQKLWQLIATYILTRENVFALVVCLVAIGLLIVTTDSAPTWIYQGF
jgi:hypothetical protein